MEEIIDKLAREVFPIVCREIDKKDWEELKKNYQKLLYRRYATIDTTLNTEDYESLYESLYESEVEEWSSLSAFIRRSILIKDEALEEILNLSNEAFKLALERYKNKRTLEKEEADATIEKLKSLASQVNEENSTMAKTSIKEGILDILYASNQSDTMSERLTHYL